MIYNGIKQASFMESNEAIRHIRLTAIIDCLTYSIAQKGN